MTSESVQIGDVQISKSGPLGVIAGPCVIESRELTLEIAAELKAICRDLGLPFVFKASFDKANRTASNSYRGIGIEAALKILADVNRAMAVPVTTDIHESQQAAAVGRACQLIQIPAFLARQTDLLVAAAATGRAVNVKKGQFMAPWDMKHVLEKLNKAGCNQVLLTERGTFFGYGRLVNDMRAIPEMSALSVPIVFDATHSVQEPSAASGVTGGQREMVPVLAAAAVAAGCHAIFLETHPTPDTSPSDAANMVPLSQMRGLLAKLVRIHAAVNQ